jgi:hypothetical protein
MELPARGTVLAFNGIGSVPWFFVTKSAVGIHSCCWLHACCWRDTGVLSFERLFNNCSERVSKKKPVWYPRTVLFCLACAFSDRW